jgi:hypothetical protein
VVKCDFLEPVHNKQDFNRTDQYKLVFPHFLLCDICLSFVVYVRGVNLSVRVLCVQPPDA